MKKKHWSNDETFQSLKKIIKKRTNLQSKMMSKSLIIRGHACSGYDVAAVFLIKFVRFIIRSEEWEI